MVERKEFQFQKCNKETFSVLKKIAATIDVYQPPLKEGSYTSVGVYYATENGEEFAAKCIDSGKFPNIFSAIEPIAKLVGIKRGAKTLQAKHVYYLSEYCNAGSLDKYIANKAILSEQQLSAFIFQIARQLSEFKKAGVYHGEITPANILVNIGSSSTPEFRICGFGHCVTKPPSYYQDPTATPYYDPRMVAEPQKCYDVSCDVWSLGVLAYQLATGALPFPDRKILPDTSEEYLFFDPDLKISPELCHLISRCLMKNWADRISVNDIPLHPYFIPIKELPDPYVISKEKLGTGKFAEVFECSDKNHPLLKFAVKILNPLEMMDAKSRMLLLGEIAILRKVKDCPFALRLVDYFKMGGRVHLVLEHCDGGDLESYISKKNTKVAEFSNEVRIVAYSLACALATLHSMNIIHRDIKLKNLLVKLNPGTKRLASVKLGDFGVSKESVTPTETLVGTVNHIAPEVFMGLYTSKVDVWSYGIVLFALVYGKLPSSVAEGFNIYSAKKIRYPEKTTFPAPEELINLIKKCLVFSPDSRYSMTQVLDHSYFRSTPIMTLAEMPAEYEISSPFLSFPSYTLHKAVYLSEKCRLLAKMLPESAVPDKNSKSLLDEEVLQLIKLRGCPGIFQLHHCFFSGDRYCFLLDSTDCDTLEEYQSRCGGKLTISVVKSIGKSVAEAVNFMHARNMLHGNLVARSVVLVSESNEEIPRVKLSGYSSLIQTLKPDAGASPKTPTAIPKYVSKDKADEKFDIEDFGALLCTMAFGSKAGYIATPPHFPSAENEEYKKLIKLLQKCLAKGTKSTDLINDPFFVNQI